MRWIQSHFSKYKEKDHLDELINSIDSNNWDSRSNGCLMRATPLSVYLYGLEEDQIFEFTKRDVNLTHTNMIAVHVVTCYNIAIAHLLNNFGDSEGAVKKVDNYINTKVEDKCTSLKTIWEQTKDAKDEENLITAKKNIGYVLTS